MNLYAVVLRFAEGNYAHVYEAESDALAVTAAITEALTQKKERVHRLPLLEAIAVPVPWNIARVAPETPVMPDYRPVLSVIGLGHAVGRYVRMSTAGEKDSAKRQLIDWFDAYGIGLDFTGEK